LAKMIGVDFSPVVDLRPGARGRFASRLRLRIGTEAFVRFGWVSPRALGVGAPEMLRVAREINPDLTMVHSETGLWVAKQLLDDGKCVGVDFEDWFSQDLRPEDRRTRPVRFLRELERMLLERAHVCLTTSRALAMALAKDAGVERLPAVVPNCFPASARKHSLSGVRDDRSANGVSFHWFSQTIGPGRGLESLAEALAMLNGDWVLSLRGALRGYRAWFDKTFPAPLRERIIVLDPVPNMELLARTMSHDVGLALEEPYCSNRDLTAANKIFEYLRAGLGVIATSTQGHREVMNSCPNTGLLVNPADPVALAGAMQKMLDEPEFLNDCRRNAAEASTSIWAWERHEPVLLKSISDGLAEQLK
jgi:glycosyltransferase involved in cell wall biosynthesis